MSGFAFATGACVNCKRLFVFNPVRVPSVRINGIREPLCQSCVVLVNDARKRQGLPEWPVPADAYEAVDEQELFS